jgi:biopolymer transport protein ExbD
MGMSTPRESGKKGKKSRVVLSEINVTPLVDVMLVLLIIFMVASGVQTVEMQSERQKMQELAEEKLEEPEAAIAELGKLKSTQVSIDSGNSERLLHEARARRGR